MAAPMPSKLFGCLFVMVAFSTSVAGQGDRMYWKEANDSRALCNDYTRAGFFLKSNNASNRWVIFLESGSLCYNNETCNRRFFNSEVSLY